MFAPKRSQSRAYQVNKVLGDFVYISLTKKKHDRTSATDADGGKKKRKSIVPFELIRWMRVKSTS